MTSTARIAALDAALKIEETLIRRKAVPRDVIVDRRGHINTFAHGSVPALKQPYIIGAYNALANAEMIAEDLLSVPEFLEAHA